MGQSYFYAVEAIDPNSDSLTYTLDAPEGMTIDETGRISWQPKPAQFGSNLVNLQVSDGRGGVARQEFTVNVVSQSINSEPRIDSTPSLTATINQQYQYNLKGTDPDGDPLFWSLDSAPPGMSIDPETGAIRWIPKPEFVGEYEVAVRVSDAFGAYVGQAFTLTVRGVNVPPIITSIPLTTAAINKPYNYVVLADDVEKDALTFSLKNPPGDMTIDPDTGLIQWTPGQAGTVDVEVLVEDSFGDTAIQRYAIAVSDTAANQSPAIVSIPVLAASVGDPYHYAAQAIDPEGNPLTYQLLKKPAADMTINPITGEVTWDNPTLGNHQIVVGAVDSGGLGAAQGFTLIARENQQPVIDSTSIPSTNATPGGVYSYDIHATDPDGGKLTFSLDEVSRSQGMTLDALGRLRWTPNAEDIGTHEIKVAIADDSGATVQQNFTVNVATDAIAPKVSLIANYNFVNIGEPVTFQARATDNIKVEGLQLLINGNSVAIDSNGMATVSLDAAGVIEGKAIALDAAGNEGVANISVQVIDASDTTGPLVELDLSAIANGLITSPTDIKGTVSDRNLDYYKLEVAPVAGGEFTEIFRRSTSVENGILGTFDPSVLQNDSYILRLTAFDKGGNISTTEEIVDVTGELKLGNFRLSFTDLVLPVLGIPITVTRTYDSLNANNSANFGYGWRLEFRDTDLRTSVGRDELYEQTGIPSVAFKEGTRVYITLPGGKRTGFTFQPVIDPEIKKLMRMGARIPESMIFYNPAFKTDDGSYVTLNTDKTQLIYNSETGKYYSLDGSPYNPANIFFGGKYKLTTKEGIIYEIDALTGDLLTATDINGNKLTFSDAGIFSDTGKSVTFERDAIGRITTVTDPEGHQIKYSYNASGDLVAVTDRENNATTFEYDASSRRHFLTEVNDPLGRKQVRTEYDEQGRLKRSLDTNGADVEFIYDPEHSIQTVFDQLDNPTTYEYDERGNVVQEIDAKGGITKRTYDENNNLLSETDSDGVTTEYTYDSQGNVLSIVDEDGNTTRMTYGARGRLLSIVSPTGLTVSSKYDSRGNLISSTDADSLITTYSYDNAGRLVSQVGPDGQTIEWGYDSFGNPNSMVDSRGNEVRATYDLNGRMQNATTQFTLNGQTNTLSTSFIHDSEGRITSSSNSQGNTQSTVYNALGQIESTTDILGNVTSYVYDKKGRLTQITLPDNTPNNPNDNPKIFKQYDAADRLTFETSPTGLITQYVYDELGRLVETILPDETPNNWDDNPRVKTEYTAAGRVEALTDIFGNQEKFEYDSLSRLMREKDILGNYTAYTYNKGGQLASIIDETRNRTTSFVYDDKARLTEIIFFDDKTRKIAYDELGRVESETNDLGQTTSYEYDQYGQVKAVVNALNERTEFEYDQRRNLVKVTDTLKQSTRYEYDQYSRPVATVYHTGDRVEMEYDDYNRLTNVIDENQHATQHFYNNLNQLTALDQASDARTNYAYDNLGRLIQIEDALHNVTQYEYEAFNRTLATELPMEQRSETVYDKFGFVKSYTDLNGDTINYTYDRFGRLESETFTNPKIPTVSYTYDPITSQIKSVTDGRGVTSYSYDSKDRLESITSPDGKFVKYGYDALGNVAKLTTDAGIINYTYDPLGSLDTVKEGSRLLADYDYNAVGNLERTIRADGTVETRQYDSRNRLTNLETLDAQGNVVSGYTYILDEVGNRQQLVERSGRTVDYIYDELNRLTQEKITDPIAGNRTVDYGYDLAGNRQFRNDSVEGLTTYTYNANNQLTQTTRGATVTRFTYDENGSLRTREDGTQTTTYDWINDGENRLVGVTIADADGSSRIEYVYDAAGNRVASIVDGVRTNYLVSPGGLSQVLLEYDGTGQVTKDYTYGLGLIRDRSLGDETFYHQDGLGSTRYLTDATQGGLIVTEDCIIEEVIRSSLMGRLT